MRLVYLSPVPWASFAQRPHKFVEWFQAKNKSEVLWVDPYPTRLPVWADYRFSGNKQAHLKADDIPSWLTVNRPRSLPVEPLIGVNKINLWLWGDTLSKVHQFVSAGDCCIGVGKPSRLALCILDQHAMNMSFYDAMDDFPAFYSGISRRSMERNESEIAEKVSRLFVSSSALAHRFERHHLKCTTVMNACDPEKLPTLQTRSGRASKPVLGYIGTIGHWFDWALIMDLAKANPCMVIRLIGPMHVKPDAALPDNIEMLPACDHVEAMQHLTRFDVGLIPFKKNDLTASVDPIKYYEYRAMGLPVISSDFGEMSLRDEQPGVFLVDEKSNLFDLVKLALAFLEDIEQIWLFQNENSWSHRFESSKIFGDLD
ncbi:glycosyltransferase involved in cell wall biosynthesis [Oxalobacteraceae bacterium GrIS 2.11]